MKVDTTSLMRSAKIFIPFYLFIIITFVLGTIVDMDNYPLLGYLWLLCGLASIVPIGVSYLARRIRFWHTIFLLFGPFILLLLWVVITT